MDEDKDKDTTCNEYNTDSGSVGVGNSGLQTVSYLVRCTRREDAMDLRRAIERVLRKAKEREGGRENKIQKEKKEKKGEKEKEKEKQNGKRKQQVLTRKKEKRKEGREVEQKVILI